MIRSRQAGPDVPAQNHFVNLAEAAGEPDIPSIRQQSALPVSLDFLSVRERSNVGEPREIDADLIAQSAPEFGLVIISARSDVVSLTGTSDEIEAWWWC